MKQNQSIVPFQEMETRIKQRSLKLSVISDLHLYSSHLGTEGNAFQACIKSDRKLLVQSEHILDEALRRVSKEDSSILLITGDLTKDGEFINHKLMREKLANFCDQTGKRVFVINGNHDVQNERAFQYLPDGTQIPIETINARQFRMLYGAFGYDFAVAQDMTSLSYAVDLDDRYRLIAIDSCIYSNDQEAPYGAVEGRLRTETLHWIGRQLDRAKAEGKIPLAMMHHGLVPHFSIQPILFPDYLVQEFVQVRNLLAEGDVQVIFTGHFHSQNISSAISASGKCIYDIETGSIVTWPCPIRTVELFPSKVVVSTQRIESVKGLNLKKTSFAAFAAHALMKGLEERITGILIEAFCRRWSELTRREAEVAVESVLLKNFPETSQSVGYFLTNCMYCHSIGDPQPTLEMMEKLHVLKQSDDPVMVWLGRMAASMIEIEAGKDKPLDNEALLLLQGVEEIDKRSCHCAS